MKRKNAAKAAAKGRAAKAAPKAKAVAEVLQTPTKERPARASLPSPSPSPRAPTPTGTDRKPPRGADEGRAQRAIELHVKKIPKDVWAAKRNDAGQPLFVVVLAEIVSRKTEYEKARLGTRSWCRVVKDFGLAVSSAGQLEMTDEDTEIDANVLKIIEKMHGGNPVLHRGSSSA